MAVWQDVQIANRDLLQVELELNRKLRQLFSKINPSQLTGGLPDFDGILPLAKGGTGQNLGTPTVKSILYYDIVSGRVAWLLLGSNITISAGTIDTTQDIAITSSPTFKSITISNLITGANAQLGDIAGGNYVDIDSDFRIYENNLLPDRILFYDSSLGSSDWLYPGNSIAIANSTLDTIQDIRTTAGPTFAEVTLSDLTPSRMLGSDAGKTVVSLSDLTPFILGTANEIDTTNNGDGTITLSTPPKQITTLTDTDTLTPAQKGYIICNKATAMTVNLPTISGNTGLEYNILNIGAGTVTIDPNGSETIMSSATVELYTDESFNILATATEWRETG